MRTSRCGAALLVAMAVAAAGCAAHQQAQVATPAAATAVHASAAGSEVLARRCGGCHATPDPNQMSAATWDAALERMKRRMQLPAADWDSLATLAQPAGAGAKP